MSSRRMQFVLSRTLRGSVLAICGLLAVAAVSYGEERPAPRIAHGQPASTAVSRGRNSPLVPAGVTASYLTLPLAFEANQGQTDQQVKFLSRGRGYGLFLTGEEAILRLRKPSAVSGQASASENLKLETGNSKLGPRDPSPESRISSVLRMKLAGANRNAKVVGLDELPGKSNYFIGNDPTKWRTNVPNYGKVKYEGVYPGIDLVYYGNQRQLEYDFVVAPGADPGAIRLGIVGAGLAPPTGAQQAAPLRIDASGDLVIATEGGEVRFHKPVVYQEQSAAPTDHGQQNTDSRKYVDGRFALRVSNPKSKIADPKYEVSFELAAYDPKLPLVIDPVLSYATYLGGTNEDAALGIAVDSSGSAYVTGYTYSSDFPTASALDASLDSGPDVFVTKMSADGSSLVYSTYLGGNDIDSGYGIAVDSSGNAYVAGYTGSTNFPTASPFQGASGGSSDVFVTKINAAGSALTYSSYLGGSGDDYGNGIALDSSRNAYIAGYTSSTNFPTTNPMQSSNAGLNDAFVTKVNASGSAKVYSTYLGGSGFDVGYAIAVDSSGNAYVTGSTDSTDFPTTNPLQGSNGGTSGNAFITKLNAAGNARVYSTYLGGSSSDSGTGIAVDSSGNAYVTGIVNSPNFPTAVNFLQLGPGGGQDIFVSKINAAGTSQVYTAMLGGPDYDTGSGITVDANGSVYVTGYSGSSDYPLASPVQSTYGGGDCEGSCADVVLSKINTAGNALIFSTYLGGDSDDLGNHLALDSSANAYVAGTSFSTNFPATPGAFQEACQTGFPGCTDAIVAKFSGLALPVVYLNPTSLSFGSLGVGFTSPAQSVTLENRGDAALNITSVVTSGDFAVASNTCGTSRPAGSSCTIGVTFKPTTISSLLGSLTITDSAYLSPHVVGLSGIGLPAPVVTLSTPSLGFGSRIISTTGPAMTVTLTNTGTAILNISSVVAGGDFTIASNTCGATLEVSAGCQIDVTYTPSVIGSVVNALTINDDAPGNPHTVTLTGTGVFGPTVTLSASSLGFGSQTIGTSSTPRTITVSVPANASAVTFGSVALAGANPGDFAVGPDACSSASVAPGGSCAIRVTFTPQAEGARSAGLLITSNASGSPHSVTLSGTGALARVVTLSPSSLGFGSQRIGTSSAPQTTTFSVPASSSVVTFGTVALGGANPGDFAVVLDACSSASVSAGGSCAISVTFTPQAEGARSAGLLITSDASGSPHTVTLSGTGIQSAIRLSPTTVNFAGNPLNVDCPSKEVTLTNSGQAPLTIASISITGEFTQTNNCPTTLAGGASCAISVKFHPTVVGVQQGMLAVTSDAPGSPHTVAVTGNGTPPCALLAQVRTATVLRGTESANFDIKDQRPSCSPVQLNLSCTPDNPAQCALNPAVIPPSGASTLKVSNLRAVGADAVRVVVNSTSEFRTASEAVTVLLAGFAFSSAPDAASVAAGQTASYALAIRPVNGLAGSISLACSGAPQGATCAVTPASVTLDGVSLVPAKLTVTTTGRATAPGAPFGWPPLAGQRGLFFLALLTLGTLVMLARRRRRAPVVLAAALLMLLGWAACGGGGGSLNFTSGGTPAGTYALMVKGTYTNAPGSTPASLTNSTTVTLKVN